MTTLGNSPLVRELMNNELHRGMESKKARVYNQMKRDALYDGNFEGDYTFPDGSHRKRMIAQPINYDTLFAQNLMKQKL
jgi:hypothetical protein